MGGSGALVGRCWFCVLARFFAAHLSRSSAPSAERCIACPASEKHMKANGLLVWDFLIAWSTTMCPRKGASIAWL